MTDDCTLCDGTGEVEIYDRNGDKCTFGCPVCMERERPAWAHDVDNETMFYCSTVMWDIYKKDPGAFGEDSRECRRVALIAAEYFESLHDDGEEDYWDRPGNDYTDEIWDFMRSMEPLQSMEYPGSIQNVNDLVKAITVTA